MAFTINQIEPVSAPVIGKDFHREYTPMRFEVITDSDIANWPSVLSAIPISIFSPHPDDSSALCVNIRPQRDPDHPRYWIVEYDYSTRIEISQDGQPQTQSNPLERKGRIRYSGRRYTEAITQDIEGSLIRNAALDPYEHVEDRVLTAIQIQRCLPFGAPFGGKSPFETIQIENYMGAINNVPFLGRQPREVLCDDLDVELKQDSGGIYWDVNALFVIKRFREVNGITMGGWLTWKLNAGYRELVNGAWVPISEGGQRPARPVLLDSSGQAMDPGTPAEPAAPLWLYFYTKPEANFNDLGLLT